MISPTGFRHIVDGQQRVLRARLSPSGDQARRQVSQHHGPGEAAGPAGARAARLLRAQERAGRSAAPVDPTVTLLNSPMPVGGLGLRLTRERRPRHRRQRQRVYHHGRDRRQSDSRRAGTGGATAKVNVAFAALDMSGNVKASGRKSMDLAVRPEATPQIAERGLRLVTGVRAPARALSASARRARIGERPERLDLLGSGDSGFFEIQPCR